MNTTSNRAAKGITLAALLSTGALWVPASTAGCINIADATYHIGQGAEIFVKNQWAPGHAVREGSAAGDGTLLLRCATGEAKFMGAWEKPPVAGSLVPLKVGGKPSGFGIELFIKDLDAMGARDSEYPIDTTYSRLFVRQTDIYSQHAVVRYVIRRMTGPVVFGRVDQERLATQKAESSFGGWGSTFRWIWTDDLTFKRFACSIVSDDLNQKVELGDYHVGNFANADQATPWVKFQMRVEECQDPVDLIARFTFGGLADQDPQDPRFFRLTGAGAPKNVALELANDEEQTIEPGVASDAPAQPTGGVYTFNARLKATTPFPGAGSINQSVVVQVDFL